MIALNPRDTNLTGRCGALALLRRVSESTINKGPKRREPRGGQAHQLMLDLVDQLLSSSTTDGARPSAPPPTDAPRPLDPQRPDRWLVAAAIGLATVLALAVALVVMVGRSSGRGSTSACVLVDTSSSTRVAQADYVARFSALAQRIATKGSGEICVIFVGGRGALAAQAQTFDVGPDRTGSQNPSLADGEIQARIHHAATSLRRLLAKPAAHGAPSAILATTVAAASALAPGDTLLILSDGIEDARDTGDFWRTDLSRRGIGRLLASLARRGLVANLRGVRIEMPFLVAPGTGVMSAQQAVRIRSFWERWARRTGGRLVAGLQLTR